MKNVAVIMAGGAGERFWPISRQNFPKQLLKLNNPNKSLLEEAVERILPLISEEDIYIITNELLLEPIRNNLKILPSENIIAEPAKRNTAPCLALSAAFIAEKYAEQYSTSEISIAVLTADHIIKPEKNFLQIIENALKYVATNNDLATIGIKPTFPHTGFGYIEVIKKSSINSDNIHSYKVKSFYEKPSKATAEKYFNSGNFYWNSGMFFWRLDYFINELINNLPEVGNCINKMQISYNGLTKIALPESNRRIAEIYESMPSISIDYGLMEKAKNVVVFESNFEWDDLGSWDALERHKGLVNNNISEGLNEIIDSNNCIIYNSTSEEKLVAVLGMNDTVIINSDNAILVCPKDKLQDVRKIVDVLKEKKLSDFI